MLSVLIPIFNYNVTKLISNIHRQLIEAAIPFEIIAMDDNSEEKFVLKNREINKLSHTVYHISEINHGRLKTRMLLSEKASYEWLLFLDADTIPKSNRFIRNYLEAINDDTEVIFGGFAYYETPPEPTKILRWRYGIKYEASPADNRNSRPYKHIISANFLIKKSTWTHLDLKLSISQYGYDSYFGSKLKTENIKVDHIDNEVVHLGMEKNSKYLKKKEQAAESLLYFYKNGLITDHQNSLLRLFIILKQTGLVYLFSEFFALFSKRMRNNLTGENPSIVLLQFYKISYLCHYYRQNKD